MKVKIQDFETAIENNQILLAEKLYETGLLMEVVKADCGTCEHCKIRHSGDRLFHLFGYYKNHYVSLFAHYLCVIDYLKQITK